MKLFVAKLSYGTTEAELLPLFESYGDVDSVKIIMDRETGRSKGFGFVEMPNDDEAAEAIEGLNGHELDGREIFVKKSDPPSGDRRGGGGRFGGGGGGRQRSFGGNNRFNREDRPQRENFNRDDSYNRDRGGFDSGDKSRRPRQQRNFRDRKPFDQRSSRDPYSD